MEFDLRLKYVPGAENVVADALSRPPATRGELHRVGDTHVAKVLSSWLHGVAPHLSLDACAVQARTALLAERPILGLRCTECNVLHLDPVALATKRFVEHRCTECSQAFRQAPAVVGNPLGLFHPQLVDGELHVATLPHLGKTAGLASLTVEPTFLGNLARHLAAT